MIAGTDLAAVIAAFVLFTTEPSDRALAGWCARDYLACELEELEMWAA